MADDELDRFAITTLEPWSTDQGSLCVQFWAELTFYCALAYTAKRYGGLDGEPVGSRR
jgi:hypothetical protein